MASSRAVNAAIVATIAATVSSTAVPISYTAMPLVVTTDDSCNWLKFTQIYTDCQC